MEQDNDEILLTTEITKLELGKGDIPLLVEVFTPSIIDKVKTRFMKKHYRLQ